VPKKVMALDHRPYSRFFCDKHRFHVVPTVQRAQGAARGHQRLSGLIRSSPVGIGQGERVRAILSLPLTLSRSSYSLLFPNKSIKRSDLFDKKEHLLL
jgi:hypothetical protein